MARRVVGEGVIKILADSTGFEKDAKKQTAKAGQSAAGKFVSGFGKVAKTGLVVTGAAAAGAVGTVMGAAITKGFSRLNSIDTAKKKLKGLGTSAGDTSQIMQDALSSVRGTAFGLGEAATIAASATAAGIKPGKELAEHLTRIANNASAAGTTMDEMGSIFNKAATQANGVQNDVIGRLADKGIPIYQKLGEQMGVTAGEVFKLASEGKVDFETFSKAAEAAAGTVAKEMGTTVQGSLANMWASVGRIGANLLEGVYPLIAPLLQSVTGAFGALEEPAKKVGELLTAKLTPAFESLTKKIEKIPSTFENLQKKFSGVKETLAGFGLDNLVAGVKEFADGFVEGFGGFETLKNTLGPVLTALSGPIGILKTAAIELFRTLDFKELGKNAGTFLAPLVGAFAQIGTAMGNLGTALAPLMTQLIGKLVPVVMQVVTTVLPKVASIIGNLSEKVVPILVKALTPVVDAFMGLLDAVMPLVSAILGVVDLILPVLVPAFEFLAGVISGALKGAIDGITLAVQGVTQIFEGLVAFVQNLFAGRWAEAFGGLLDIVVGALKAIAGALWTWLNVTVLRSVGGFFTSIKNFFSGGWGKAKEITVNALNAVKEFLSGVFKKITGTVSGFGTGIKGFFSGLWSSIKGTVVSVWDGIVGFFVGIPGRIIGHLKSLSNLGSKAREWFGKFLSGAKEKFVSLLKYVGGIPGKIVDGLGNIGGTLLSSGKALIDGFGKGIKDAFGKVTGWVEDGLNKIRDFFPHSPAKRGPFSGKGYTTYSGKKLLEDFGVGISKGVAKAAKEAEKAQERINSGLYSDRVDSAKSKVTAAQRAYSNASKSNKAYLKRQLELARENYDQIKKRAAEDKKADEALVRSAQDKDKTFAAQVKTLKGVKSSISKTLSRNWGDLTKSADAASSTIRNVMDQLSKVGTTKAKNLRNYLEVQRKDLTAVLKDREKIQDALKDANAGLEAAISQRDDFVSSLRSNYGSISSALTSGTTSTDIIANLKKQVADTKKFKEDIATLTKAGLSSDIIEQLTSAGLEQGGAAAAALVAGGQGAVKEVNDLNKKLDSQAKSLATSVGSTLYQAGIDTAQGLVDGLKKKDKELRDAAKAIADAISSEIKKKLKIKSPSKVTSEVGNFVTQGLIDGTLNNLSGVKAAADAVAVAATPDLAGVGGVGSQSDLGVQVADSMGSITSTWDSGWSSVAATTLSTWESVEKDSNTSMEALRASLTGSLTKTGINWQSAWDAIRTRTTTAWDDKTGLRAIVNTGAIGVRDTTTKQLDETRSRWINRWDSIRTKAIKVWSKDTGKNGGIRGIIEEASTGARKTAVNQFEAMSKGVQDAMSSMVSGIRTSWGDLKKLIGRPINDAIGVINNPLISGVNSLLSSVGAASSKKLTKLSKIKFASGGVMPGYTPGQDVHDFYSPTGGKLSLSGGEAIMRPEWTRAVGGAAAVDRMNAAARAGRLAFKTGGVYMGKSGSARVTLQGKDFTAKFAAALVQAMNYAGQQFRITQGGFRPRTSYSGTSHAGDAVDIARPYNSATVAALRKAGIAAWDRAGKGNWIDHVHGVPLPGYGYGAGSAVWQAQDYLRGGDGLGGRDNGPRDENTIAAIIENGGSGSLGLAEQLNDKIRKPFDAAKKKLPGAIGAALSKTLDIVGDEAKTYLEKFESTPASGSSGQWDSVILKALDIVGQPSSMLSTTRRRLMQESSGNARAINNWDSNAKNGTPSKGLMQVIDPTFAAYRDKSLKNDIWDPLANIVASMRYALSRYGSLPAAYDRKGGYASGTLNARRGWAKIGERGPELVWLGGGEAVLPATMTADLLRGQPVRTTTATANDNVGRGDTYVVNVENLTYTFTADEVSDVMDLYNDLKELPRKLAQGRVSRGRAI